MATKSMEENVFLDKNGSDMNYKETLDYLYNSFPMFSRVGQSAYKPGLDNTIALDEYFGHPHRRYKTIHVAGTNGKGSTSHMLAAILQEAGYKVGLYTSPHLTDFRERIRVNGKMISEEYVMNFVEQNKEQFEKVHPSFFEMTMMMAFRYFEEQQVDWAVIEVGLGGRLDSTNIIVPEVSVITNVALDHTSMLGQTTVQIAKEKAGIIKQGIPVVVGDMDTKAREVVKKKAEEENSQMLYVPNRRHLIMGDWTPLGRKVQDETGRLWLCGLEGEYQKENMGVVLEVLDVLRNQGVKISREAECVGIENVVKITGFQGRWQIIGQKPMIVADIAHNPNGMEYTMKQLGALGKHARIVIGVVSDKDVEGILEKMLKDADYYFTNAKIPRALPVGDLYRYAVEVGLHGRIFSDVRTAVNAALKDAQEDDVIYIGGSNFVVAEFLEMQEQGEKRREE